MLLACVCRYDPLSWEYPSWASINGPAVNILKGALLTSDRVVTVSEVWPACPCAPCHILLGEIESPHVQTRLLNDAQFPTASRLKC